ncbi:MAG TPA: membrane dipeptidase [Vicinamibacterales bacterium]|nr:membrane dipeptidase [Vicinamibacterales bacterium]
MPARSSSWVVRTLAGGAAAALVAVSLAAAPSGAPSPAPAEEVQADAALVERARAIHDRVITLDTHADINANNFRPECNYAMRLTTQVNLPKMEEGGLDVAFFIVYVGQGPLTPEGYDNAYRQAVTKFDAVHALASELAPNRIGLALTAADVRQIAASSRKVAVIGIENGYSIGTDITRVKEFHDRGGRYMSLAHNGHSQLSDSNTGERDNLWMHGGLSPLGRQAIAEMNRWGIMIDVSHPSKASALQSMALSRAPVIASHSAVRSLADHSRNMDDELLMALKANGGVMQTVAFASYVRTDPPGRAVARTAAMTALRTRFGLTAGGGGRGGGGGGGRGGGRGAQGAPPCPVEDPAAPGRGGRGGGQQAGLDQLTPEQRTQYDLALARINAEYPPAGRATVADFVDHIDYAVRLIGIDHVGISSDFDGGGGVDGWNSASETFNVTLELVRRGYTEEQIAKLWSGNLLRVWAEVERVARDIQAGR